MFFRLCMLIFCRLSFVAMANDFPQMLGGVLLSKGIGQERINQTLKALADNGINNQELLCLSQDDLRKEVGLHFTVVNVIINFCKPSDIPIEASISDLTKLSVLDLLNRLATNPQDANALESLQNKRLVKKAQARTTAWAAVHIDENGKRILNAQATYNYLRYLIQPTQPTPLNKTHEGYLIESVDILGKTSGQILLHPLFDNQCITMGYDQNRLYWKKVPLETMKALLWARKTKHSALSRLNFDPARIYGEVAKEKIDDVYIQEILEDYQLAIRRKDPQARFITLEPSQAQIVACAKKTAAKMPAKVQSSMMPSKESRHNIARQFAPKKETVANFANAIIGTRALDALIQEKRR